MVVPKQGGDGRFEEQKEEWCRRIDLCPLRVSLFTSWRSTLPSREKTSSQVLPSLFSWWWFEVSALRPFKGFQRFEGFFLLKVFYKRLEKLRKTGNVVRSPRMCGTINVRGFGRWISNLFGLLWHLFSCHSQRQVTFSSCEQRFIRIRWANPILVRDEPPFSCIGRMGTANVGILCALISCRVVVGEMALLSKSYMRVPACFPLFYSWCWRIRMSAVCRIHSEVTGFAKKNCIS